ncbi:cytochrome p450 [Moniliophthora roreri MCA 2997]|uniref:Cytochrome p450 n=2 Tax=Moniliophthora roreri TaxID=221103 RepID=V2XN28_MONRO|nr:cytochrome p450 [Moniliophthora roreri MCA 2997]KAI3607822.1 cytochrome p450 [Moniliophthora roreri]
MHTVTIFYLVSPALLAGFLIWYRRSTRRFSKYPPGPKPWPLIGNLFDIPTIKPWKTFSEWGHLYGGDLFHFEVLGQHVIVINSRELAHELFEKRSRIYSDRPHFATLDLMGWTTVAFPFMPYGETWRQHRRIFEGGLRDSAASKYLPVQMEKTREFLVNLLNDPGNFRAHIKSLTAATIIGVMYGHDIASTDDYFVELAEKAAGTVVGLGMSSTAIVNIFPFMRYLPAWFPGCGFQQIIHQSRIWIDDMIEKPYAVAVDEMNAGGKKPSFLAKYLDRSWFNGENDFEQELTIKRLCALGYAAGAETTVTAFASFFLAMATYPQIQKHAQEEIDRVIGKDRLPTYDDRPKLPYIEAVLRETLRWRPVAPLGIFHAALSDDTVNGYYVPKGTPISANIWAMTRDETVYPDPESFIPERYLTENGTCNSDDLSFTFGFGRRICPGRHLASESMWAGMASVLAAFDITKAKDEAGDEIEIDVVYSDGLVSHPEEFRCSITPRSDKAQALVSGLAI